MSDEAGETELDVQREMVGAPLLCISDPTPVSGSVTEYQANVLYQIFKCRCRDLRPVWTTINVASRSELGERIGEPNADRLIDGACTVFCNWPSYRCSQQAEKG